MHKIWSWQFLLVGQRVQDGPETATQQTQRLVIKIHAGAESCLKNCYGNNVKTTSLYWPFSTSFTLLSDMHDTKGLEVHQHLFS